MNLFIRNPFSVLEMFRGSSVSVFAPKSMYVCILKYVNWTVTGIVSEVGEPL